MHGRRKRDDQILFAVTALATFAAALGVSGGTNVWMLITKNDLIEEAPPDAHISIGHIRRRAYTAVHQRADDEVASALAAAGQLSDIACPILGGPAISLLFHVQQGNGGLVNWTMPRPWRWNLLGYYHFVYMSTQFSYMLLFLTQLLTHLPEEEMTDELKKDLALIGANLVAFGLLLYTDYY